MANDEQLDRLARQTGETLHGAGLVAVTAESCTGGWIAKCMTDVAGSSNWFDRAFITYSDAAKVAMLDVPPDVIERHGAVSDATVRAMAVGALTRSGADISVAASGVAGPGGGSVEKPVGSVWLAWALRDGDRFAVQAHLAQLEGDRESVRRQSVALALEGLIAVGKPGMLAKKPEKSTV